MTDLKRLLPEEPMDTLANLLHRAVTVDALGERDTRLRTYAAMRQSLATAFEQAKEEGRRERVAELTAHRACHAAEHDPEHGKIHGYCVVCGIPWPCTIAKPEAPPAAAAPEQTPAVPERAETPCSAFDSQLGKDLLEATLTRAEQAESRCRQVEASLATLTAELTEANGCEHLKAGDGCSCELLSRHEWAEGHHAQRERANRAEAELTEARAARERAEQALRLCKVALDGADAVFTGELGRDWSDHHYPEWAQMAAAADALRAALTPTPPPAPETERQP